jgi:hypothetical protein
MAFLRSNFSYIFYTPASIAQVALTSFRICHQLPAYAYLACHVSKNLLLQLVAEPYHIACQGHLNKAMPTYNKNWAKTIILLNIILAFLQHVS